MNALAISTPATTPVGHRPRYRPVRPCRSPSAAPGRLANERARRQALTTLVQLAQRAGPYLVLELLLPGGTLFALLLFIYRNRSFGSRIDQPLRSPVVVSQVVGSARRIAPMSHKFAFAGTGAFGAPLLRVH